MKNYDRIKLDTIELFGEISDFVDIEQKYDYLRLLVKLFEEPLGYIQFKFIAGKVLASEAKKQILNKYGYEIIRRLYRNSLINKRSDDQKEFSFKDGLTYLNKFYYYNILPFATVAVCTKDRTETLRDTLKSLKQLKYPNFEVIIVDNAPSDNKTKNLIASQFSKFKYVLEPRKGLDFARNTAIETARGEFIAFIDDDAIADENWLFYIGLNFALNPEVKCVTGLVCPFSLENKSSQLFEQYGGFGRGFSRKKFSAKLNEKVPEWAIGSGAFGTGTNMAFSKKVFDKIGLFDPALDVGTPTNGGGDLDMFFRIIKEKEVLVYEPRAIVFHKHREDYKKLKVQIRNNGVGFYSFLVKNFLLYTEERISIVKFGVWWFMFWILRRGFINIFKYKRLPFSLIFYEALGVFQGLGAYLISKRKIKKNHNLDALSFSKVDKKNLKNKQEINTIEVLNVDLEQGISEFYEFKSPSKIKIFLFKGDNYIGDKTINISSGYFTSYELAEEISQTYIDWKKMNNFIVKKENGEFDYETTYENYFMRIKNNIFDKNIENWRISIVIATKDRYEDLVECLDSLNQTINGFVNVEIIVVDNASKDDRIKKLKEKFPYINLLYESRTGLSYARNRGILNSSGDIIITLDDDVVLRNGRLKNILKNFQEKEVACVTANVLPKTLKNKAQILFEKYGGLGRGKEKKIYDLKWFQKYRIKSLPTWEIGATACAAFRSEIFSNSAIGLLKEELGAGTPSGCSEDTYLFYQILKNGYKIVYEPSAIVYHKHRDSLKALRKQIFNYSKGHVAYHILIFLEQKDLRGLTRIFFELPFVHFYRIYKRILMKSDYPINLLFLEIIGNLIGPFALLSAFIRTRRLGRKYEIEKIKIDKDALLNSQKNFVEKIYEEEKKRNQINFFLRIEKN